MLRSSLSWLLMAAKRQAGSGFVPRFTKAVHAVQGARAGLIPCEYGPERTGAEQDSFVWRNTM